MDLILEIEDKSDYSFNINVSELPKNKGASYARNYGAIKSTGDILFFIDADCQLYPGMIRECVTQFELDESISFVYKVEKSEQKVEK